MSQLNQIKKHQILFHDGELAEFVSFYTGANKAGGILIFKIKDKYYLNRILQADQSLVHLHVEVIDYIGNFLSILTVVKG